MLLVEAHLLAVRIQSALGSCVLVPWMLVICFQWSACCGGVGGLLSLLLLVGKEVAAAQMLLVLATQIRIVVRVLSRGRHLR